MTKQDTINVDLPIRAKDDGRIEVLGIHWTREYWREIAVDPGTDLIDWARALAPAVVAWIERDEWEPQDVPDEGRVIATTEVVAFDVRVEGRADGCYRARRIADKWKRNKGWTPWQTPRDWRSWDAQHQHPLAPAVLARVEQDQMEGVTTQESPTLGDLADVFRNWNRQGVTLASIEYVLNREYPEAANRQPTISAEQVEAIVRIVMDTECEHGGSCDVGSGDRCSSPENGWLLRGKIARRIRAAGLTVEGDQK